MSDPYGGGPKQCEDCGTNLDHAEEKVGRESGYYLCESCQRALK